MMKNIYYYLFLIVVGLNSCRKDFLNRYPQDEITTQSYWKTAKDLELYVNQFYVDFPGFSVGAQNAGIFTIDNNSDNMVPVSFNPILGGTRTIPVSASDGGWSWENIRSVNIFLANYHKCESPLSQYNTYVGEALFFKAYFYFDLLERFGAVPWYTSPLEMDSKELYNPRTPRNVVADSILSLLDDAIGRLESKKSATPFRVSKEVALLLKSRVALYEGTWEKYHSATPFGVSDANPEAYLQVAATAVDTLMKMGTCDIYSTGQPSEDYVNLFNQSDYSGISEVMLWKKFDRSLGMGHSAYLTTYNGHGTGLSKSLVDSYLCTDGLPISSSSVYKGDATYIIATKDRDPRLAESIFLPGDPVTIRDGVVLNAFVKPGLDQSSINVNTTGYQVEKGHRAVKYSDADFNDSDNGSIIFRYAEALLNYAEAKAELGTISQKDIDISINKLRARVGMPPMELDEIRTWHDPKWQFPALSPIINEVRRERRVELACEGYRFNDLMRWAAGDLITGERPLGAKFVESDWPGLAIGKDIFVDPDGYIDPYQKSLPSGWKFNPQRDYLSPIPISELTLNKNLAQNPGW